MMGAGLLAKKAVAKGLKQAVGEDESCAGLESGLRISDEGRADAEPLEALKFNLVGYGCTTCIGNSGPLPEAVSAAVKRTIWWWRRC